MHFIALNVIPHSEHGYDISTVPERLGHKDQVKRER
jgi:hypothetical protein